MDEHASVALVVRDLGSTWRALRLYPPSSPMPRQTADAAAQHVAEHLDSEPSLKLVVVREGFLLRGVDRVFTAPGVPDLTDALGAHSIAEIGFIAPPTVEDVLGFLAAAWEQPRDIQERGGLVAVLTAAQITTIRLVPVALANAEAPLEIPEDEADTFLARLAADSTRLAQWLRSLLTYDDEGLSEGLLELANAAGDVTVFGASLARAFLELESDGKDRLLEVSMYLEPVLPITDVMLANLSTVELTAAVRGGRYGANPLSLSWALARLPLGERAAGLVDETAAALLSADASEERIALLRRLIEARKRGGSEPAVADASPTFQLAIDAARLQPAHLEHLRAEVEARRLPDATSLDTVLGMLDSAEDFAGFSRVVDALARTVPRLLEEGDPALAMHVVGTLAQSEIGSTKPWPEIEEYLKRSLEEACGERSMAALLTRFGNCEEGAEYAGELVAVGGDRAALGLADAVMASEDEAHLACARNILGRRLPEILAQRVNQATAQNGHVLATLFATDASAASLQALQQLATHPEDRIRSETARAVCAADEAVVARFIPHLLRDDARDVQMVAARALGRRGDDLSLRTLTTRLGEFEDDKDLLQAREVIGAIAAFRTDAAVAALTRFAEGGSFLKKRRSAEMRRLAKTAAQGGAG